MKTEEQNKQVAPTGIVYSDGDSLRIVQPLEMVWSPKEDITAYELAKCIPYLLMGRFVVPYDINISEPHFRHFNIIDWNKH